MGSAIQQWGWLATSQKSRFQAAKRSNMSSAIQQEDRSPDAQESRIRLRNVQIWALLSCCKIDLLMFRNRVFSVRKVQKWVLLSSNLDDSVILRNRFFRLRNGEIFSTLSLKRTLFKDCWCSGIQFSSCKYFKYAYCRPARGSISYFTDIVF